MKRVLELLGLAVLVFFGAYLMFRLYRDGFAPLASFIGASLVFIVLVFLRKRLTHYRWLATAIVLVVIFVVYPIFYSVYLSFTNMSNGHLQTKQQAIQFISRQKYVPDNAPVYSWLAYKNSLGNYLLLLTDEDGNSFTVTEKTAIEPAEADDEPDTIGSYHRIDTIEAIKDIENLSSLQFGIAPELISIESTDEASTARMKYIYNEKNDSFTDDMNGVVYRAQKDAYVSASGDQLIPGFMSNVGFLNYIRFLGNRGYRKPITRIIVWNFAFAFFSVLFSFGLGLAIAMAFEDLPGNRIIRTMLIIPYPIPVLVSIMVWRGLFNEQMGLVTQVLRAFFGSAPHFFTETFWCQFALVLINVYLSYPYFYILSSGALKSISSDIIEAAKIDGAGTFSLMKYISMPMVLRILSPLLIASFSFNFNNFTIIWGFNAGLPAIADAIVPMGHTDLLISFIYRLGFSRSNAADYGFSAAITVLLFVFVAIMTATQMMTTHIMKEEKEK